MYRSPFAIVAVRVSVMTQPAEERAIEAVRMVAVRVDHAYASPGCNILLNAMFEELRFAGTRRPDYMRVLERSCSEIEIGAPP